MRPSAVRCGCGCGEVHCGGGGSPLGEGTANPAAALRAETIGNLRANYCARPPSLPPLEEAEARPETLCQGHQGAR